MDQIYSIALIPHQLALIFIISDYQRSSAVSAIDPAAVMKSTANPVSDVARAKLLDRSAAARHVSR